MFKIALDAGHGMYTPGKRCLKSLDANETREWYLNDRIADRVEKLLESFSGYSLLRVDDTTGDVDVSLASRVTRANEWGADFYLSIHHNAGVNGGSGGGIVSIAYTGASEKSIEYQKLLYDELINAAGLSGNRSDPVPKQNLYVLRETDMPAVLIECGFMDSSTDVPVILTEEFANRCAEGIVNTLVKIGGLVKKEQKGFSDISGHYAEKAIRELQAMGIVNGMDSEHFCPDEPIDRADVAIIARNIIKYVTGE